MTGTTCALLAYVFAITLIVGYASQLWWQWRHAAQPQRPSSVPPRG